MTRAGLGLAAAGAILVAAWLGAPARSPAAAQVPTFEPAGDATPLERLPGARASALVRQPLREAATTASTLPIIVGLTLAFQRA